MSLAESIVSLLREAGKTERRTPRYGFSDAAGCPREHVYAFREYETTGSLRSVATPLRWVYQKACGDGVGAELEAAARRLGWQTQVPVRWDTDGLLIEGTADIVGPDFVLDGKYVSAYTWRSVQKEPKREHWLQIHGYGYVLDKPNVALLYQRFTEKGEEVPWCVHDGETDPSVAAQVLSHWVDVELHRRAKTLPERAFGQDSFDCKTCIYAPECWKEAV